MATPTYLPGPAAPLGPFEVTDQNIVLNPGGFTGYANLAALASIPSYLITKIGALAYTLDGKWYRVTSLGPITWTEITSTPSGPAGADLGGTYPTPIVVAATGAGGVLPLATTAATVRWAAGTTTPTLKQDIGVADANGQPLRIESQTPAVASTNRAPGNLELAIPTPTGTGADGFITWFFRGTRRGAVGWDNTNSKPFLELGPTASVAPGSAVIRVTTDTRGIDFRSTNNPTKASAGLALNYLFGQDLLTVGYPTNPVGADVIAPDATILNATNSVQLWLAGVAAFSVNGSQIVTSLPYVWNAGADRYISIGGRSGNNPTDDVQLVGQVASLTASGSNKSAGWVTIIGGTPTDAAGSRRSFRVITQQSGGNEALELRDVGLNNTSYVMAELGFAPITTTQLGASSGNGTKFLWNCQTAPTAAPLAGGNQQYAESGAWKTWGTSNARVQLAGSSPLIVEAAAGTTSFSVDSLGASRRHAATVVTDLAKVRTVATNGGSLTIANTTSQQILDPAALIAGFTVTMPAAPQDGQVVKLAVGAQRITAITHNGNAGQTLNEPLTGMVVNAHGEWTYHTATTTWFRTG